MRNPSYLSDRKVPLVARRGVDLTGRRFGRLVVLERAEKPIRAHSWYWLCRCDCGVDVKVMRGNLLAGCSQSCGCLQRESAAVSRMSLTRHGMRNSSTYRSWVAMKSRCLNPNASGYERYGGCGISVCARWMQFENFLTDMGARPPGTSIDRYPDPAGNYEPGNCRWGTRMQQRHNRRPK